MPARRVIIVPTAVVLSCVAMTLACEAQGAARLSDSEIVAQRKAHVERLVQADSFSGAVLIAKDGKTLWSAAYGIADRNFNVPNKIDTKFNLGSMNKMFTAVANLQHLSHRALAVHPGMP